MTEKILNTRIINKHETQSDWEKSSFIPKQGEVIIYDIDANYSYERMKIGDGVSTVNQLPFIDDSIKTSIETAANLITPDDIDAICGAILPVVDPNIDTF